MSDADVTPIRFPRMAEVIAGDLRRRIATGELAEGQTLPLEAELVARYGVSRPTVRETIRILESQALITVTRGSRSGAVVQPPDLKVAALHSAIRLQRDQTTLGDVFVARVEISLAAARLLAARRDHAATDELRALHEQELHADPAASEYARAVTRFHGAVVELAGNHTLMLLRNIVEEIVHAHERTLGDVEALWVPMARSHDQHDHERLIELVERGDPDAVERLWRPHLARSAEQVLARLGPATVVDILGPDGLGR